MSIVLNSTTDESVTEPQPLLLEDSHEAEVQTSEFRVEPEPEDASTDVVTDSGEAAEAEDAPVSERTQPEQEVKPTPNRLLSLDAFRGLTILGMLSVNNIALDQATPKQMLHADWSGAVHLADLVFPWFLLIVGVALPYAAASRIDKGEPYWRFVPKVLGRAITLILLGCLIDSTAAHRPLFDLNVLQLIGLAYCVGALVYPLGPTMRSVLAVGLLGVHWYILKFMPQPGAAPGTFNETHNAIIYLNQTYLARYHLSGLVSVLPASAMVLIGTIMGDIFHSKTLLPWRKAGIIGAIGIVLIVLGYAASHDIPFNKPLWSPSFILFTAGWGGVALGTMYVILDVKRWRWWALPFLVFGSNAIFAYVAPILVKLFILQGWTWPGPDGKLWPLQTALLHSSIVHFGKIQGGLFYTASYVLIWWIVLFVMYRRHVFLRV